MEGVDGVGRYILLQEPGPSNHVLSMDAVLMRKLREIP